MIRSIFLAGVLFCGAAWAQGTPGSSAPNKAEGSAAGSSPAARPSPVPRPNSRYRPDRFAGRAGSYYRLVWGVDSLGVKWAESGEVLRFTYRVLDPNKAKALNDKKNEPVLIDPQAGSSWWCPRWRTSDSCGRAPR